MVTLVHFEGSIMVIIVGTWPHTDMVSTLVISFKLRHAICRGSKSSAVTRYNHLIYVHPRSFTSNFIRTRKAGIDPVRLRSLILLQLIFKMQTSKVVRSNNEHDNSRLPSRHNQSGRVLFTVFMMATYSLIYVLVRSRKLHSHSINGARAL